MESSVGVLEYLFLVVSDQFQVYTGHSNFLDNLMSTSNFGTFGMPVDNVVPTDINIAVSSRYFYILQILLFDRVLGWSSFTAAMATNTNQGLRTRLIESVYHRMYTESLPGVCPVYYNSVNGTSLLGIAR